MVPDIEWSPAWVHWRVGGNETIDVDVRILAATHRDLEAMMREGRFREDLFPQVSG